MEDHLLNALSGMTGAPTPLIRAIQFYADGAGDTLREPSDELCRHISAGSNDPVRKLLHTHLGRWDWEADTVPWTQGTEANTLERRARIYQLLEIDDTLRKALDENIPPFQGAMPVIINDPRQIRDWYTLDFRKRHNFYWTKVREFLETTRGIKEDAINSINAASD
nr:hypothetical protein [Blastocatellia bacterium]